MKIESKTLSTCKSWKEWRKERKAWEKSHPIHHWFNETIYYPLFRAWETTKRIPKEIKWFIQRGSRGWSDRDVWNMSDYLSQIIPDMLKQLKNNKQGVPIPEWFCEPRNLTNKEFTRARKEWNGALNKMIKGFIRTRTVLNKCSDQRIYKQEINEAFDLFKKHYFDLWD